MSEKILFIEGPSGSGKTVIGSTIRRNAHIGGQIFELVRGMPSQKDSENERLPAVARRELRGVNLNFHEASHLSLPQLIMAREKLLRCDTLLLKAALNLKNETGHNILLNRSGISQTAIFLLAQQVATQRGEEGDEERAAWAREAEEMSKRVLLNDYYLGKVDGIIHLERRVLTAPIVGRSGMAGLEDREGDCIAAVLDWVLTRRSIPVLKIDVNTHMDNNTKGQEIAKTMDFINSL